MGSARDRWSSARAWRARLAAARWRAAPEPLWETGTFSILGFDPATGEVGGAVQSRVFSVGNGVLWADANAGDRGDAGDRRRRLRRRRRSRCCARA